MRIDHHAYQRATRVAGVGFLVQLGLGLTVLMFGLVADDSAFIVGSAYPLISLLAWLALIIILNQHTQERLEALEEDETAMRSESAGESVFTDATDETRVAGRRLAFMYKWFLPGISLIMAAALALSAWLTWRFLQQVRDAEAVFDHTDQIGWAVALCLAFAASAFIFSRFVAGMAKQTVWQNLRGGAAAMVGNALVCLALAVGVGFRFFEREQVIEGVVLGLALFQVIVAAEIVFNFVLNIYRPRIPGEMPRAAFDSRLLSLFAAPDNLVRTINEAVNYQFGFDIASSWGYKLLLRSFAWLLGLGVAMLVLLNMMVIVEPEEQAVKLSHGRLVSTEPHRSGLMWKLPWPFETVERHEVGRIRELPLTSRLVRQGEIQLWADDLSKKYDTPLDPFIVESDPAQVAVEVSVERLLESEREGVDEGAEQVSTTKSLIDAEISLQYRIRENGGLLDYLSFGSERTPRNQTMTNRDEALRAVALREITQVMSKMSMNDAITMDRSVLAAALAERVQSAYDAARAGVEVVAVIVPLMRPSGSAANQFEEVNLSRQEREQEIAMIRTEVVKAYALLIGSAAADENMVDRICAEIDAYNTFVEDFGANDPRAIEQRTKVERMIQSSGGGAEQQLAQAERDRWKRMMEARTQNSRLRGQLLSYRVSPRLYRARELARIYKSTLQNAYKYVVGIDPERVEVEMDLQELNSVFTFSDVLTEEESGGTGQ